jgi:predicted metal-dependent peptidase
LGRETQQFSGKGGVMERDECMRAATLLQDAKVAMVLNAPFFGVLAAHLEFYLTDDIETMATDGKRLLINPQCVNDLGSTAKVMCILMHEVLHCALSHMYRRGDRQQRIWNYACDYAANAILWDVCDHTDSPDPHPALPSRPLWVDGGLLFDPRFSKLTTEEIYEDLLDANSSSGSTAVMISGSDSDSSGDKSKSGSNSDSDGSRMGSGWSKFSKLKSKLKDAFSKSKSARSGSSGASGGDPGSDSAGHDGNGLGQGKPSSMPEDGTDDSGSVNSSKSENLDPMDESETEDDGPDSEPTSGADNPDSRPNSGNADDSALEDDDDDDGEPDDDESDDGDEPDSDSSYDNDLLSDGSAVSIEAGRIDSHELWRNTIDVQSSEWEARTKDAIRRDGGSNYGNSLIKIDQELSSFHPPQLSWQELLAEFAQPAHPDWGFDPPDNRFWEYDFFLPDEHPDELQLKNVYFYVDSSGSISQDVLCDFASEVVGCYNQYGQESEIWYGTFSTEASFPILLEDPRQFKIEMAGGTDPSSVFEMLKVQDLMHEARAIIILTDGFFAPISREIADDVPVLWIVTKNGGTEALESGGWKWVIKMT